MSRNRAMRREAVLPSSTNPRTWTACPDCKLCPNCIAGGQYGLTRQEVVILRLLCSGVGTRDIIAQLHIKVDTLKRHMSNIFNKTGVDSRTQLVVFAVAKGLATIQ
jgi:DNA-binding NarL/FixJ family response regulator